MALIHYYKFNNNLYDSIGAFDLVRDFGTTTYITGKLGGSSGAVTSASASMYIFGCAGTGGAASGFLAADTTEAAAGVSSWSMTGWVYCSGTTTQIINLLSSTSGQSSAFLQYDQKFGGLTFRASGVSCSTGTWVFFTVRATGGTCYLSVNGGSESSSAWNTGSGTGGKTQFNGIRIGSPSLYIALYARVDDVRVFNHSLSSGEIAGIYNSGSPAEATTRSSNALTPYRHYKFNSSLADSSSNSPSLSAVVSGLYATSEYTTGLAANTNQSIQLRTPGGGNSAGVYVANSAWYKSTGRNSTDSIAYMWWSSNPTFGSPNTSDRVTAYPFMSLYSGTLTVYHSSGSTNITQPTPLCLHKAVIFDGISKRFTYYENSNLAGECTGELDLTTYYPEGFYAWISSTGDIRTFRLDDMRFYGNQISGIEVLDIYNGGAGTEATPAGATASGAFPAITVTSLVAVIVGTASASANLVTVQILDMSGFKNATATGGLSEISVVAPFMSPNYLWKFQNSLLDSISGYELDNSSPSVVSYQANPWGISNFGNSIKFTGITTSEGSYTSSQCLNKLFSGTVFDRTNYNSLSWTACFWLKSPGSDTDFTPSASLSSYMIFQLFLFNTRITISRDVSTSAPQPYNFNILYTPNDGIGFNDVVNVTTSNVSELSPEWIALSYDRASGNFKVALGSSGILTQSFSGYRDVSSYRNTQDFRIFVGTAGARNSTSYIDDLRLYPVSLSLGQLRSIYNNGLGSVIPINSSANGSFGTITVSAPTATTTGGTFGAANGLLSVVTIIAWSGTASDAYASGLLKTITVSPITGISPLAFGSLRTIQVTSFSGQAAGGALSSGALASVTVSSFAGIAFPEFIGTGSLGTVSVTAIEAVASISTSIQLSYCACDAEIGWQQSLPITGFVSAVQGEDAISARITPVVSGIDANIVFFEQRTLTASSSYTYDLRSLTDFLGQSFSLSRVYAISVVMTSGSATISPGVSNPLKWFFNSNTANVTITSGNSFMFAQKGSAIVSNSAKTILVTNPSGLSACVYKIAILGGR